MKAWIAFEKKNREKIKSRIRKGVPDSVRMHYWPLFTGALEAQAKHPNKYSTYQKQLSVRVKLVLSSIFSFFVFVFSLLALAL